MADELKDQLSNTVDHSDPQNADRPSASCSIRHDRRIEIVPVTQLKPHPRNARVHSRKQVSQIAGSVERFGFNNPILIDEQGQIIAGHGRVEAAKLLGLLEVPTLRLSHMSEAEVRAYIIADNKLAEKAGWDRKILAAELECLIDLNVEVVGFDPGEIEVILEDADAAKREAAGPEDTIPELAPDQAVSREGDLWILDKHRLLCADARDNAAYDRLLEGDKAGFVFADPPYNMVIAGHADGSVQHQHGESPTATGEMSAEDFTAFLETVFKNLTAHSENGSVHDICVDWRHIGEVLFAGKATYSELLNVCVWARSHIETGQLYRNQHEFVTVWKSGSAPHLHHLASGSLDRDRSNLWRYPSMLRAKQRAKYGLDRTVKPVALVADAIRDCSRRNDIVLDPFVGSGTSIIAAERIGRHARGIELDPVYVDTAIRRWQEYTGKVALLAATGRSFEETEEERKRSMETTAGTFRAAPAAEAA